MSLNDRVSNDPSERSRDQVRPDESADAAAAKFAQEAWKSSRSSDTQSMFTSAKAGDEDDKKEGKNSGGESDSKSESSQSGSVRRNNHPDREVKIPALVDWLKGPNQYIPWQSTIEKTPVFAHQTYRNGRGQTVEILAVDKAKGLVVSQLGNASSRSEAQLAPWDVSNCAEVKYLDKTYLCDAKSGKVYERGGDGKHYQVAEVSVKTVAATQRDIVEGQAATIWTQLAGDKLNPADGRLAYDDRSSIEKGLESARKAFGDLSNIDLSSKEKVIELLRATAREAVSGKNSGQWSVKEIQNLNKAITKLELGTLPEDAAQVLREKLKDGAKIFGTLGEQHVSGADAPPRVESKLLAKASELLAKQPGDFLSDPGRRAARVSLLLKTANRKLEGTADWSSKDADAYESLIMKYEAGDPEAVKYVNEQLRLSGATADANSAPAKPGQESFKAGGSQTGDGKSQVAEAAAGLKNATLADVFGHLGATKDEAQRLERDLASKDKATSDAAKARVKELADKKGTSVSEAFKRLGKQGSKISPAALLFAAGQGLLEP